VSNGPDLSLVLFAEYDTGHLYVFGYRRMFGQSRLIQGLLCETNEAVAAQVTLWDRSTVWHAGIQQAAKTKLATAASDYLNEKVVAPVRRAGKTMTELVPEWIRDHYRGQAEPQGNPIDGHVSKFCRLFQHAGLRLDKDPSAAHLHDLGLQIERNAIQTLAAVDDRSLGKRLLGAKRQGFTGTNIDDLVRYVISKTFDQLDEEFRNKTPAEQEEIAGRIAAALRDLPPEEQERICRAARLPDLTAETLRQTGRFAKLGVGLSATVGLAGFTAYTTLTSVVAAVTGLVGIHLSFGFYMMLTSSLAGLTNPLLLVPLLAGGGGWMTSKANHKIRGVLYPTFVATSVMSLAASDEQPTRIDAFVARIHELIAEIGTGAGPHTASLVGRFPGLGSPALSARLASHVTA
jgi:hypothetical protein